MSELASLRTTRKVELEDLVSREEVMVEVDN